MSSDEVVIEARNVSKRYEVYATPRDRLKQLIVPRLYRLSRSIIRPLLSEQPVKPPHFFREFWALQDVSFRVKRGETVGIIGRNGSGKSTLLQIVCSTLAPTQGDVTVQGRVSALLELGSGFNPEYTGRENIFLNGQILGLSHTEIDQRYEAIVEFADIGHFIDQPIKVYSSGMVVRLAFAVAVNVDPHILVVDEALAVGDAAFQRKCMLWMEKFTASGGTLLFVSHSGEQVRTLCDRALYLREGRVAANGTAKEVCDLYDKDALRKHPSVDTQYSSPETLPREGIKSPILPPFAKCAAHFGGSQANIVEAWTEDEGGRIRAAFSTNERFIWAFRIKFSAAYESVVFGFMIKTKEGVNLYRANSITFGDRPMSVRAGEIVIARFAIDSHLGPNDYFLNCAVSTDETGEMVFLHRIVDAQIVTISSMAAGGGGLVDMQVSFSSQRDVPVNVPLKAH